MDIFNIFSAFGLSASAGLNAYIPLLVVAVLAKFTNLIQPAGTVEYHDLLVGDRCLNRAHHC